jgi:hypothetical protein
MYYILDENHNPVAVEAVDAWLRADVNGIERRVVGRTEIGPYLVSTTFLGVDHGYREEQPILFETMVFDETGVVVDEDGFFFRYTTWEEAKSGHEIICFNVRAFLTMQKPESELKEPEWYGKRRVLIRERKE